MFVDYLVCRVFTPQPIRAVRVLFSPMVSRWVGVQAGRSGIWVGGQPGEKVCRGYISETVRCRKLKLGRDIGYGVQVCNGLV